MIENVARALAQSHGLDFDEVCGVDADPDNGYCDSGTCIASGYEDHDATYARAMYRADARAAIAAMQQAQQWQGIESAPRDGTLILVPVGHGVMDVVSWWGGAWRETANALAIRDEPTHWMPLPTPPAGGSDAE